MSSIFDLYTAQQVREIYFEDERPRDYEQAIYEMTCATLYANATKEEIKAAEIEAIDNWTYDQDDDYGFRMGKFTGVPVEFTEAGPQKLLFQPKKSAE